MCSCPSPTTIEQRAACSISSVQRLRNPLTLLGLKHSYIGPHTCEFYFTTVDAYEKRFSFTYNTIPCLSHSCFIPKLTKKKFMTLHIFLDHRKPRQKYALCMHLTKDLHSLKNSMTFVIFHLFHDFSGLICKWNLNSMTFPGCRKLDKLSKAAKIIVG